MLKRLVQVAPQQKHREWLIKDRSFVVETLQMLQQSVLLHALVVPVLNVLSLELSIHALLILHARTQAHTTAVLPGIMPPPTVYSPVNHPQTAQKTLVASHTQPATRTKPLCAALVSRMLLNAHGLARLVHQVIATLENLALPTQLVLPM
jgi:hypothetical protein